MSSTETRRADHQRRSPKSGQKLSRRTLTEHTFDAHHGDSSLELTTKGGPNIANRQRIGIKAKLRDNADFSTLAYVLHVMAKRRVDARRRLAAEERAKREEQR
jgi:hypothetical protein